MDVLFNGFAKKIYFGGGYAAAAIQCSLLVVQLEYLIPSRHFFTFVSSARKTSHIPGGNPRAHMVF